MKNIIKGITGGCMLAGSKYHSRRIISNGEKFDSKKEAARYKELKTLERAGIIQDLQRQVKYVLIPAQYEHTGKIYVKGKDKGKPKKGKLIERECAYYADFVYCRNGEIIVEDVKGYKKGGAYNIFVIKRKLMIYIYGIKIKEL